MILQDGLPIFFLTAWFIYQIDTGSHGGGDVITITVPLAALLLTVKLVLDIWERLARGKKNGSNSDFALKSTADEMEKHLLEQGAQLKLIDQKIGQIAEEMKELRRILLK